MAINSPRLVVEPTYNNELGAKGSIFVNSRGFSEPFFPRPAAVEEGQLVIERLDTSPPLCNMYVSVDMGDGVYEWKLVQPITEVVDTRTGRSWDPAANYLYSYAR